MMDTSIDLMQYAAVGGVMGILVSLIPIAIYLAGAAKRDAKREARGERRLKKKEAKKAKKANKNVVSEGNQQSNQEPSSLKRPETVPVRKEVISQLQENEQSAKVVSHWQEGEEPVGALRQVQEDVPQVEALKHPQENVQCQEEVRQSQGKMQQVEELSQEQERQQVELKQGERVQQVEVVNKLQEEPQIEKIMSQLEQKCQRLEEEKKVPVILNFYKVSATQKEENKRFVLDGYLTIGRSTGYHNWTIDDDLTVSGNHCKIYPRNKELYILDLNSTNGTYVNGQRVRGGMKLSTHDKIGIGQSEYRIEF